MHEEKVMGFLRILGLKLQIYFLFAGVDRATVACSLQTVLWFPTCDVWLVLLQLSNPGPEHRLKRCVTSPCGQLNPYWWVRFT